MRSDVPSREVPVVALAVGSATLNSILLAVDRAAPAHAIVAAHALPVLLAIASRRPRASLVLASISTAFILVSALASPSVGDVLSSAVAICCTWAIAGILASRLRLGLRTEELVRSGDVAEKELADFKDALDKSSILAITDQRGVIKFVNDKFCEISKYSREELVGQDHRIINSGYHSKEFIRDLWRTIAQGSVWRGEIRNRAKDGSIYWVDTTIVPFLDASGKPVQYVAIRNDITERKQAQARLLEQASLTRLGEMAAVVAHEVKNPLAGISGALEVIGARLPADDPDKPIVGEMLARLDALDAMVQDLLLFARPRAPRLSETHLVPLLRETTSLLAQDRALRNVAVVIEGDEPVVRADAQMLSQVFQNLVLNAAQAMGGKGTVHIGVHERDGSCVVSIADHGPGIAPDMRARIFEPFFTTKHRGTGLGLAVARRMIEAHGGTIEASETPGGGATMTVRMPVGG